MGTHGSPPTRVLEAPVKWTRPARTLTDLQVGLKTLSTVPVTLEDYGRPHPDRVRRARLAGQASPYIMEAAVPIDSRIAGSSL
jgi:hypothetical protein